VLDELASGYDLDLDATLEQGLGLLLDGIAAWIERRGA